ncbi:NUDIX hydrolase [Maliponia aquimaris]|uniref:NUDIX domain protein n=1 Tax=Maliponia aquimaris TaxID=1673631 RepID=A0A238L5U5_9RHOB|nr:NUDIX hydrolase [Maliponia aquimaris]SMX50367.1 NUDIX domain protein [Maliponia aquimaris]
MRIEGIGAFAPRDARDAEEWARLAAFCAQHGLAAFSRDPWIGGHVTASGAVLSPDGGALVLLHHRKLDRWLQPGGHCDGIADARFVALREVCEETGLARVRLLSEAVYDIDIHEIPARGDEPAHLHYDVRFLMQAEAGNLTVSDESHAVAWVRLTELERHTRAESVLRLRARL